MIYGCEMITDTIDGVYGLYAVLSNMQEDVDAEYVLVRKLEADDEVSIYGIDYT